MFFYETSVSQSSMHMYLRSEAGMITERMSCSGSQWDGNSSVGRDGLFRNVEGHEDISMIHGVLLNGPGQTSVTGSWHAADGVAFRRAQGVMK